MLESNFSRSRTEVAPTLAQAALSWHRQQGTAPQNKQNNTSNDSKETF